MTRSALQTAESRKPRGGRPGGCRLWILTGKSPPPPPAQAGSPFPWPGRGGTAASLSRAASRLEAPSLGGSAGGCLDLLWLPSHVRRRVPNRRAPLTSLERPGRHGRRSLLQSRAALLLWLFLQAPPPNPKLLDLATSGSFYPPVVLLRSPPEQPSAVSAAPRSSSSSTQHPQLESYHSY